MGATKVQLADLQLICKYYPTNQLAWVKRLLRDPGVRRFKSLSPTNYSPKQFIELASFPDFGFPQIAFVWVQLVKLPSSQPLERDQVVGVAAVLENVVHGHDPP
jgi:hypothetical protein